MKYFQLLANTLPGSNALCAFKSFNS